MIWVCFTILTMFGAGAVITRETDIKSYSFGRILCKEKVPEFFARLGFLTVSVFQGFFPKKKQGRSCEDIKELYSQSSDDYLMAYRVKKTAYFLMIIFIGTVFAFCMELKWEIHGKHEEIRTLTRGESGEGDIPVNLDIYAEGVGIEKKTVTLYIPERGYSSEEELAFIDDALEKLPYEMIRNTGNTDLFNVDSDLNLPDCLSENPVCISWDSSNYEIIDTYGHIYYENVPASGIEITLSCNVSLEKEEKNKEFVIRVIRKSQTPEESVTAEIQKEIERECRENSENREIELPNMIMDDSVEVTYRNAKKDKGLNILIFSILFGMLLYIAFDRDLHRKVLKRNEEMEKDYAELLSKIVLLLSSGMTLRGAFHKIAGMYVERGGEKRDAYEEIRLVCNEMDSGIAEEEAYINLGKRSRDSGYIRLSMLLSQNLRKGGGSLCEILLRESQESFAERKRNARRIGEEASTKLLGPMLIMLVIVMAIIMIPAFWSF